ncbi:MULTISPECIES: hypothetical protein [unclassified Nodularia (in: cyanobacteria)]|uniref:hypothetical protein n=1 Tax=unclassified Nodularia (in: cyanobacteria) TaxID=2656917 RepID=UPI0018823B05|nr:MULTISPECIES: hypothetical protein [unclassified Nodularia (in: cyanobacteria)]MBE9201530.1 hypothetical protein [Nodularia sp. LEGE 06071]MCC2694401.1 hypothetical protein [Nodularia sp. LEGE 04288]
MLKNIRLLQLIKKYGVTATVTLLVFLGGGVTLSECGGFVSIKMSDSANEFLVDKRNCKAPSDSEESEKSFEPDQPNDSTEEQPRID